jgi:hypothetical protein
VDKPVRDKDSGRRAGYFHEASDDDDTYNEAVTDPSWLFRPLGRRYAIAGSVILTKLMHVTKSTGY